MTMFCCPHCFDDSFLLDHISKLSKKIGNCSFCARINVPVISPDNLTDDFQAVISAYTKSQEESSSLLLEWLRNDWGLFNHLSGEQANLLLVQILDDPDITHETFLPIVTAQTSSVMKWSSFREEIMWKNRFFFKQDLDLGGLQDLFEVYLETDSSELNNTLYRARIQQDDETLSLIDMGRPPAKLAKNGRANPLGIPYLYTASTPETAIAEVRPHPGDRLWVAKFDLAPSLRLLNLRHPKTTISPFQEEQTRIPNLRQELAFLSRLEEELSKPILPRVADLEYLPTQYLCEFIKNCGYEGVVFKSSISQGVNVALFNDDKVQPSSMTLYEVTELNYQQVQVG